MKQKKNIVPTDHLASITPLAPWIAETKHRKRAGKVKKVMLTTLAIAVVGGGTWVAVFSDILALDPQQVVVNTEPDSLVDRDAVTTIVHQHKGKPLVRISTAALVEQAGQLPGVKNVEVSRAWPTGLTVDIESRAPAAAVASETGFSWVDNTGVVVGNFPDAGGLVLLEVPLDQPRVIADMVTVWQALTPDLQTQVRVVQASTSDDISAVLHSGKRIQWGSAEQLKLKVATALALLDKTPESWFFDVSSPGLPITR